MPAPITPPPVVIVGAGFAGIWLAKALISRSPPNQDIIVIERASHFAYLYALPRFSVLQNQDYAEKLFIPYGNLFKRNKSTSDEANGLFETKVVASSKTDNVSAKILHGEVISIDPKSNRIFIRQDTQEPFQLCFSHLVICTGASMDISGWEMSRIQAQNGRDWLKSLQRRIANSKRIAIIGGGAYGVQIASDIADLYGTSKKVTLIQSRDILVPQYHRNVHDAILPILKDTLGIDILLNTSAISVNDHSLDNDHWNMEGTRRINTSTGQSVDVDLIIKCTGTTPNSSFLSSLVQSSRALDQIPVSKTLQVYKQMPDIGETYPQVHCNIYAIGDVSATGTDKLAGNATTQATIVAHNIVESMKYEEPVLQEYTQESSAVKLTLGIQRLVTFEACARKATEVSISETSGREDVWLDWIWQQLGHE